MSAVAKSDQRQRDLAQIHIAKKALGWSDDEYRDLLWTVCSVRSSSQLDSTGRARFLAHQRSCGWTPGSKSARAKKATWTPTQRLIWSLWQQLADAELVQHRERAALDAWIKAHVGVDRVEFLNRQQQQLAIESLKAWLGRSPA